MKLKKIASLMLAGIMAVSMLAGCKDGASSNKPTEPDVDPVDTSFAASVNNELSDEQKALVSFTSSTELANALNVVAKMIPSSTLDNNTPAYIRASDAIMDEFLDLIEGDVVGFSSVKNDVDKDQTYADIYVVPGNYTEEGMLKAFEIKSSMTYIPEFGNTLKKLSGWLTTPIERKCIVYNGDFENTAGDIEVINYRNLKFI